MNKLQTKLVTSLLRGSENCILTEAIRQQFQPVCFLVLLSVQTAGLQQ